MLQLTGKYNIQSVFNNSNVRKMYVHVQRYLKYYHLSIKAQYSQYQVIEIRLGNKLQYCYVNISFKATLTISRH